MATRVATERYIAMNRFRVKPGREAAYEKRWADRKSQLGLREGFRFFCMLRRADGFGPPPEDDVNFISCTIWESKDNFDAWRTGDAFKEAHGGGTIGGIASMLLATARNTKGKPKLASWEGLLPQSTTPSTPPAAWKQVEADGVTQLDGEAFVAMNRFSVVEGSEDAFEARFANRESTLMSFDGFKGFMLLRREGSARGPPLVGGDATAADLGAARQGARAPIQRAGARATGGGRPAARARAARR